MKRLLLIIFLCHSFFVFAEDLITKSGETYKNYTIHGVSKRGVSITHSYGGCIIPFEELPDNLQREYASFFPRKHRKNLSPKKNTTKIDSKIKEKQEEKRISPSKAFDMFDDVGARFRRELIIQYNLRSQPYIFFDYAVDGSRKEYAGYIFTCSSLDGARYRISFYAGWRSSELVPDKYFFVTAITSHNGKEGVCLEISIKSVSPAEIPQTLKRY